MTVFPQSVYDPKTNTNCWCGIETEEGNHGIAYEKAMFFCRTYGYEYYGNEDVIDFRWSMSPEDLHRLYSTGWESNDYCESVFFGDFKVEFIQNEDVGGYVNCFLYGVEGYGKLENGIPYDECDDIQCRLMIPADMTLESFASDIERQIIDLLNAHPDLIQYALKPTDPDKWYPNSKTSVTITMKH